MMNSVNAGEQQGANKQEFVKIQQSTVTQRTYDPSMDTQQMAGNTLNQSNQSNQLNQQSIDQPVQLRAYSASTTSQQMPNLSGTQSNPQMMQSRTYSPSMESQHMLNNISNQQLTQQPIQQSTQQPIQQSSVMPMNTQQMGNSSMSANQLNQQSNEQPMQQNYIPPNNSQQMDNKSFIGNQSNQQSFDQQQQQQQPVVNLLPSGQQQNQQQYQQQNQQENQQSSNFPANQGFNQVQPSNNVYRQSVLDPSNEATSVQNLPQFPQLFHEPRSSIIAPTSYSYEDAWQDASTLRSAMKGLGTNEGKLISISSARTQSQRLTIKQAYLEHEKRDLVADLTSELSGNLQKSLVALYMEPGELDARLIYNACKGLGTNDALLIEILCTRTNEQLYLMQEQWNKLLNNQCTMSDSIKNETQKFLVSGNHFQKLLLKILQCKRPQNVMPNNEQVQTDAEELYRMLSAREGEAKDVFITIFTDRSWQHIAAIADRFESVSTKYTLHQAIKERFGHESNTAIALSTIAEFSQQPYDYWAKKMLESMKGIGTNEDQLIRVIVSRCDIDLANIRDVFGLRYGDGKTLKTWLEGDLSGSFRNLLLKLCGY